jgi:predicted nucleotidyltransferase
VDQLRHALAAFPKVRVAVLFGSQVRGTGRVDSDVDVAVLGADEEVLRIAAELSQATGKQVDVISLKDPSIPLSESLIREGISMYEAEPGLYAEWRSRTLATLETDRPWYARMRDAWIKRVAEHGLF